MKLIPFLPKTLPFPFTKLTQGIREKGLPILKAFWRPILLVTVGAHAAILSLPQTSSEPQAEIVEPMIEEEVKITSLKGPKKPKSASDQPKDQEKEAEDKPKAKAKAEPEEEEEEEPKAKAKPEEEVEAEPKAKAKPEEEVEAEEEPEEPKSSRAVEPPPPPLEEEPPEEEALGEEPPPEEPAEEEEPPKEEPPPEEPPEEEPPPEEPPEEEPPKKEPVEEEPPKKEPIKKEEEEEDNSEEVEAAGSGLISELRDRVLSRLSAGGDAVNNAENTARYLDSLPIENVPESRHSYFFEGDRLKSGALSSLAIAQSSPSNAYNNYIEPVIKDQLGFKEIDALEEYGGELLYKAKNEEGIEFYMSLVKLKLGAGTLVIIWPSAPGTT